MKKDIQPTEQLYAIFDRYSVRLRTGPQVVEHEVYGLKTEVPPMVFAA